MYAAARDIKVREIMSREVVTVREEDTLETLSEKMLRTGHHRLPVIKGKIPVGIVAGMIFWRSCSNDHRQRWRTEFVRCENP